MSSTLLQRIKSSFRDPGGQVYHQKERIFRTINQCAAKDYLLLRDAGIYQDLIFAGKLVDSKELEFDSFLLGAEVKHLIEHQKINLITYPYEWPFKALKAAALFHLELQIDLLEKNVVLSDASPYNIQFLGSKPIFIDFLSLRPYHQGEPWQGHKQFCEQFLFPLLIQSYNGISFNAWLRGSPDGISIEDVSEIIPFHRKFLPNVLMHVILPLFLKNKIKRKSTIDLLSYKATYHLPKNSYKSLLNQLKKWIYGLHPAGHKRTIWEEYTPLSSYSIDDAQVKNEFVKKFVQTIQPRVLVDLGSNNAIYSEVALENGAKSVICIDGDPRACDAAFTRAQTKNLSLNTLLIDLTNPSPQQGWQSETLQSLKSRLAADAILTLAFLHHLVIGKNIPMHSVVNYIIDLAPQGIIEFVDKSDPQVQKMLKFRADIFPDYHADYFLQILEARANIIEKKQFKQSTRMLVWYQRYSII